MRRFKNKLEEEEEEEEKKHRLQTKQSISKRTLMRSLQLVTIKKNNYYRKLKKQKTKTSITFSTRCLNKNHSK